MLLSLSARELDSLPLLILEEYEAGYHRRLVSKKKWDGLHTKGHAYLVAVHIIHCHEKQLYCARELRHSVHYSICTADLPQFLADVKSIDRSGIGKAGVPIHQYYRNVSYCDPNHDFVHVFNPNTIEFTKVLEVLFVELNLKNLEFDQEVLNG